MTKTKMRSKVLGTLSALAFATSSTLVFAGEPDNNSFPFGSMPVATVDALMAPINSNNVAWNTYSLSSNTDVDYVLIACNPLVWTNTTRIGLVELKFLPGDFDIFVYHPSSSSAVASGQLAGTADESVNISAKNYNHAIVKVIRYAGAVGNYTLRFHCTSA